MLFVLIINEVFALLIQSVHEQRWHHAGRVHAAAEQMPACSLQV